MNQRALLAGLCSALFSGAAWSAPATLTVAWRDKPPYHYTEDGMAKGFLLERARSVFDSAGLTVRFVNEPQKRIWANFQHGATNYCSISWYRLPEREAVAQYSQPLHEDLPHTVLIAPGMANRVKAHTTLASLLTDPTLTLGAVEGVSYGPALDAMIKTSKNQIMSRTVETTQMLRMLTVGRASFMFADREDWEFFSAKNKASQSVVRYDLPDMPAGMKRHIVCSRDVSQETMNKLNQAIAATGGTNNPGHSKPTK
ncbi:transporter substrate-binding domain-containing protein [Duganella sp. FT135W]|uniref:Transporter substrate-binding domain-containing protein n=1 Tax=Duganella flavida TaxID=2692175 RepID=A0A6L8KE41_9BURK|nr:transporter substrate-binding domain-containing protein [Duganella flavida]MYM24977.1 transporter substrate-binding domain-containing protein [Duganella flavida]